MRGFRRDRANILVLSNETIKSGKPCGRKKIFIKIKKNRQDQLTAKYMTDSQLAYLSIRVIYLLKITQQSKNRISLNRVEICSTG